MSYDLFLKPRSGIMSAQQFNDYVESRRNYEMQGKQAWYRNPDTGVYFSIVWNEDTNEEAGDETNGYPLTFNINYFRPRYFIEEARIELNALVKHFDLIVSDPQTQGMGDGDYQEQKLITGWYHGNIFAFESILSEENPAQSIYHLPRETLNKFWQWNYKRHQLQTELGEKNFVAKVMLITVDDKITTAAVWPDGIPSTLPYVDYLFVPRKEYAPKKFFRRKEDSTLIPWKVAEPIFKKYGQARKDGAMSLQYEATPKDICKFIESLPPMSQVIKGAALDAVLDTDLVERFQKRSK
ncbi:hypothetical protein RF679_05980 [Undibacterium cyanobacteriorum]|uniref:Uncharacterized protein n=1 Tax=Undibacterium cyanobacteriorum TaxID=3073561 RepID=A0ABY9RLY2_9BURK|nr:hypothetical protein [Undibacterium sp. 20NA77.5]WMW81829.1 hypothetical protein RF679_05980 [Undibacterium sp. 20NA77.5]